MSTLTKPDPLTADQLDAVEKEWLQGECTEHNLDALILMARRYLVLEALLRNEQAEHEHTRQRLREALKAVDEMTAETEIMDTRIESDEVLFESLQARIASQDETIRGVLQALYDVTGDQQTYDEKLLGERVRSALAATRQMPAVHVGALHELERRQRHDAAYNKAWEEARASGASEREAHRAAQDAMMKRSGS